MPSSRSVEEPDLPGGRFRHVAIQRRRGRSNSMGPVVALCAGLLVMFGFCTSPGVRADGATPPSDDGARLMFLRDCAICHGADASGGSKGPTLQGVGRAAVDYQVSTGRMPLAKLDDRWDPAHPAAVSRRHAPVYDRQAIDALVGYIAKIAPGGPDIPTVDISRGDISRGGGLFREQCAACHEWAGEGGALQYGYAPSLDKATTTQIAEAIRVGPATMPLFGAAAFDQGQLNDVVAYVHGLRRLDDAGGQPLWHLGPVAEGAAALAALALIVTALKMIGTRT